MIREGYKMRGVQEWPKIAIGYEGLCFLTAGKCDIGRLMVPVGTAWA